MINIQIKFEGKIHYGSKVVAFRNNCTKFFKLQGQFGLKGQSQEFLNLSETFM